MCNNYKNTLLKFKSRKYDKIEFNRTITSSSLDKSNNESINTSK